ncbi:MAG: hypothetical protein OXG81_15470 [Acidobacteria bacterium]|nr:hypothetical protein [Acidobacteriota bacterium]
MTAVTVRVEDACRVRIMGGPTVAGQYEIPSERPVTGATTGSRVARNAPHGFRNVLG